MASLAILVRNPILCPMSDISTRLASISQLAEQSITVTLNIKIIDRMIPFDKMTRYFWY